MSKLNNEDVLKGVEIALAILGLTPQIIDATARLIARLKKEEPVTAEELRTMVAGIQSRNERIQNS